MSIFHWFKNVLQKSVAVAAASCIDRAPHCSHSNTLFANVDISKVWVTFCSASEARAVGDRRLVLYTRQNPIVQAPFGELLIVRMGYNAFGQILSKSN